MKKIIGMVLGLLMVATAATAGTAKFSWLPNEDDITQSYEIYCDDESLAGGGSHSLWKVAAMDNIEEGRVVYTWNDFPEGTTYYCVCVAKGVSQGQMMTSDYSDEVVVLLDTPDPVQPGTPQNVTVKVIVEVQVN